MKLNITEHLVFAFYTDGVVYLLSIVQVVLMAATDNLMMSVVSFILSFIYFAYAYTTYDRNGSRFRSIMKAIAIRVLVAVILIVLVIAGMIVYGLTHPQIFE